MSSRAAIHAGRVDQHIVLRDVAWDDYLAVDRARGESDVPRLTFDRGILELMSPSIEHERIKSTLGRLLEAWADALALDLVGYGSWTVRDPVAARGAEADECYTLGATGEPERPDLAVEVVWTRGAVDKLEVWRGLRVPEVWIWEADSITIHLLKAGGYTQATASALLPQIDVALLASLARLRAPEAIRRLKAHLRATGATGA